MKRRTFLSGLGASTFTITGVSTATAGRDDEVVDVADVDNDKELPISAKGSMVHTFDPVHDDANELVGYIHQKHFFSDDVQERYGREVISFEPEYALKEWIPADELNGPDELPSHYQSLTDTTENTLVSVQRRTRRVIGLPNEHKQAHQHLSQRVEARTDIANDIPFYLYESEDDADGGGISARQAPVNLVWEDRDASSVNSAMENGWGADNDPWDNETIEDEIEDVIPGYEFGTRYAQDPETDNIYSHDYDIQKDDGDSCSFPYQDHWSQYHIRVFDFEDSTIGAFGNVHWDPCDHNQNPLGDTEPWEYEEARDQVEEFWSNYSITSVRDIWLGNTTGISAPGDTHDGWGIVIDG
ncbi:hypothetical protein [Natronobacterium texcoconense]|nr:hypothetical protein [Natronobacterium texcoconense]